MKRSIVTALAISLLLSCESRIDPINPRENPFDPEWVNYTYKFEAVIYEPKGKEPSKGVVVKLFDVNGQKNTPVFTAVTNARGNFSIAQLPVGIYRLLAQKDSLVLFHDSLIVTQDYTTLRDDTLESPSSITGIVCMKEYHDQNSVTVQIAGIDIKQAMPDTSGEFTITGLAGGTWPLLISSTLPGYLPTTTAVKVTPCSHDTVRDTLFILQSNMPLIEKLSITQDTLAGTVRLSWQKADFKTIRDYLIFRTSRMSSDCSTEPVLASVDTFCIDSIFSATKVSQVDTSLLYLGYRIAARDLDDKIGPASRLFEFTFVPKTYVTTFFTHHIDYLKAISTSGTANDSANDTNTVHIDDKASIGDTVKISFTARNRTRPLRYFFWYDPVRKDTVASAHINNKITFKIADTLKFSSDSAGTYQFIAGVVDYAGTLWLDTTVVKFVKDPPRAIAGAEQSVLTCDTIHLHGQAIQNFGTIVRWEWKIGFGPWCRTSGPDTAFPAAAFRENMVCSLAVTDDDGNRAYGAVDIEIITSMNIKEIASGSFHNLFLNNNGVLLGSGLATSGQLIIKDSLTPQLRLPAKMAVNVMAMDGGECHTLFVNTGGIAFACGWNHYGQLGDGTVETHFQPVQVMTGVRAVAAGANHSLFLKTDGTLWTCGNNQSGQLGNSTLIQRSSPVQIMIDVQYITAGNNHTLVVKNDGTVWACGLNDFGQLGDGTLQNRTTPVQIMTGVKAVAAGGAHSLLLKTDGSLWGCGLNSAGQLGDNTLENRTTPVKVMDNVQQIAAGNTHSLILSADGSLWACGENNMGQIGDGTITNRLIPVKIATSVDKISAGGWQSLMIKKDGTVWNWGWNSCDRFGIRKTILNMVPVLYIP